MISIANQIDKYIETSHKWKKRKTIKKTKSTAQDLFERVSSLHSPARNRSFAQKMRTQSWRRPLLRPVCRKGRKTNSIWPVENGRRQIRIPHDLIISCSPRVMAARVHRSRRTRTEENLFSPEIRIYTRAPQQHTVSRYRYFSLQQQLTVDLWRAVKGSKTRTYHHPSTLSFLFIFSTSDPRIIDTRAIEERDSNTIGLW